MSSNSYIFHATKIFWVYFVQNDDPHITKLDSRVLKYFLGILEHKKGINVIVLHWVIFLFQLILYFLI